MKAVPWLRWLVAGLLPRMPKFDPRAVNMGFVVYKVELGQVSPRVLRIPTVIAILSMLHTHICISTIDTI